MTQRPPFEPPEGSSELDPPPTPEELAEAQALAQALEKQPPPLAQALRAAYAPGDLDPSRNEELIVRVLADAPAKGRVLVFPTRRWAWVGLIAAAACFVLILGRTTRRSAPVALTASRSTQELFSEQFPRQGGQSARMDRISESRARELRENRFAQWGVR